MSNKVDIFETIDNAADGAALSRNKEQEQEPNVVPVSELKPRGKSLKNVPGLYFVKHREAKESGKTSLSFTDYIIEATREKLERDGYL